MSVPTLTPQRPCGRCGIHIEWNLRNRAPGVCKDCREADREYEARTRRQYAEDRDRLLARQAWLLAREPDTDGARRQRRARERAA